MANGETDLNAGARPDSIPSDDKLAELRRLLSDASNDPYEAALDALDPTSTLNEIYGLTGLLTDRVEEEYACMRCVPGCHECCSQTPLVTPREWILILDWIQANMTADQRKQIVVRSEALLENRSSALPGWMRLVDMDLESAPAADYVGELFENESTTCPFLFDGLCSIYPVRPLICRAYGRMMRTEEDSLYCQPILDQINEAIDDGVDVELPIFRPYQEKSYEIGGGDSYLTPLAIWVLGHRTESGDIRGEASELTDGDAWPVLDTKWGFGEAFDTDA